MKVRDGGNATAEIVPARTREPAMVLSASDVRDQVNLIQRVMREVMREGEHYGKVPGCGDKRVLLKAGAEKLCLTFRLDPEYEVVQERDGEHLAVTSRCVLWHIPTGQRVGSGMGSCSTHESKYAWRKAARKCPKCMKETIIKGREEYGGGWVCYGKKGGCGAKWKDGASEIEGQPEGKVANSDLPDLHNTVLKVSNKRSLIAAVLNATAASDIFVQDVEEEHVAEGNGVVETPRTSPEPKSDAVQKPSNGGNGKGTNGNGQRHWSRQDVLDLAKEKGFDFPRLRAAISFARTQGAEMPKNGDEATQPQLDRIAALLASGEMNPQNLYKSKSEAVVGV